MAIYKYVNGLFGPRVKGYNNNNQFYNLTANDNGVEVYSKKGYLLCKANSNNDNHIFIHAKDNFIAVQNYSRTVKGSRIAIFKNNQLIKNTALYGKIEEIIFGAEDVYFMKFLFSKTNRLFYQLINDDAWELDSRIVSVHSSQLKYLFDKEIWNDL